MKRTVWLWELGGFAVSSLVGTLLHFMYELTGRSVWVAPFSGVNESTWEHMKLLFWPMVLFAIAESFFFGGYDSFWCVKLRGTLIGLGMIPLLFYGYNGIIGKSPDFINIAIFFISAAVAYTYETVKLNDRQTACHSPKLAVGGMCAVGALFIIFTFLTPELAIFRDPLTGSFGIPVLGA